MRPESSDTVDTGISINRSYKSMTALAIIATYRDSGTATRSEIGMIKFYYSGDNTPEFTHIVGDSNLITLGQSTNKTLTISRTATPWIYIKLILTNNQYT